MKNIFGYSSPSHQQQAYMKENKYLAKRQVCQIFNLKFYGVKPPRVSDKIFIDKMIEC